MTVFAVAASPATAWVLDLPALALLSGAGLVYLRGELERRRRTRAARRRRLVAFAAGWCVALLAVVSPAAGLAGELLWVHMVQHLLLTVVAAPLLALGMPHVTMRLAFGARARRLLARSSGHLRSMRRRHGLPPALLVAAAAHIGTLWFWHLPFAYDAAVRSAPVHLLEHATFLGTALWFWIAVVDAARGGRRDHGLAVLALGAQIATGGVLGALITFSGRPLYDSYTGAFGLTALQDQQLGGALMWVLPGFLYGAAAAVLLVRWLDRLEAHARRRRPTATPRRDTEEIGSRR